MYSVLIFLFRKHKKEHKKHKKSKDPTTDDGTHVDDGASTNIQVPSSPEMSPLSIDASSKNIGTSISIADDISNASIALLEDEMNLEELMRQKELLQKRLAVIESDGSVSKRHHTSEKDKKRHSSENNLNGNGNTTNKYRGHHHDKTESRSLKKDQFAELNPTRDVDDEIQFHSQRSTKQNSSHDRHEEPLRKKTRVHISPSGESEAKQHNTNIYHHKNSNDRKEKANEMNDSIKRHGGKDDSGGRGPRPSNSPRRDRERDNSRNNNNRDFERSGRRGGGKDSLDHHNRDNRGGDRRDPNHRGDLDRDRNHFRDDRDSRNRHHQQDMHRKQRGGDDRNSDRRGRRGSHSRNRGERTSDGKRNNNKDEEHHKRSRKQEESEDE